MDKRIGAQYYTIRDFVQNEADFDASCKKVAEIGYKTVQLSGIGDIAPEKIKEILDKYGLEAVCSHRPAKEYEEALDELIRWHKLVGCKIAGLGALPSFKAEPSVLDEFLEKYVPISAKLAEAGLTFAYHNHAFEFVRLDDGRWFFEHMMERTNPEHLKLILDAYWVSYAGVNPVELIEKYADRIEAVHLKDLKIVDHKPVICEIGRGNINWSAVIEACEMAGVKYALVEQDTCDGNPFDSLKISYDYITEKGLLDEKKHF